MPLIINHDKTNRTLFCLGNEMSHNPGEAGRSWLPLDVPVPLTEKRGDLRTHYFPAGPSQPRLRSQKRDLPRDRLMMCSILVAQ